MNDKLAEKIEYIRTSIAAELKEVSIDDLEPNKKYVSIAIGKSRNGKLQVTIDVIIYQAKNKDRIFIFLPKEGYNETADEIWYKTIYILCDDINKFIYLYEYDKKFMYTAERIRDDLLKKAIEIYLP